MMAWRCRWLTDSWNLHAKLRARLGDQLLQLEPVSGASDGKFAIEVEEAGVAAAPLGQVQPVSVAEQAEHLRVLREQFGEFSPAKTISDRTQLIGEVPQDDKTHP